MAIALRPMGTGELLDRTFSLYRSHFLLFVGIAIPGPALYLCLQLVISLSTLASRETVAAVAGRGAVFVGYIGGFTVFFASLLGLAFSFAATARAVSAVHLSETITVRESFRALKGRFWRIIGIFGVWFIVVVLSGCIFYGAFSLLIAGVVPPIAMLGLAGRIAGVVIGISGFIAASLMTLTILSRYSLAFQSAVIEDTRTMASLKRSVKLLDGSLRRAEVVYILFFSLYLTLVITLEIATDYLTSWLHLPWQLVATLTALGSFVGGVLTVPIVTVALSLMYFDERIRKEGFDLQLMIAMLDTRPPTAAATAP